jgi:hypothetical protein
MWETRRIAEQALTHSLRPYSDLLDETFASIDVCTSRLEHAGTPFGRVSALVLAKGRNLGVACLSLSLDALGQEAGALFRPLIEAVELLEYIRQDPGRVGEAVDDRLPKAGVISRRIQGKFKLLREYLNAHASHLSVGPEAMGHLLDLKAGRVRTTQAYSEPVLRMNLRTLLAVLVWLCLVGAGCVQVAQDRAGRALAHRVDDLRRRTLALMSEQR